MTVYVELIFLSNFFIDIFIFCLANLVLKRKNNYLRIILGGLIGGLSAGIYPFVGSYKIIIKMLNIVILPAVFGKINKFNDYIICLITFLCVSFALGGCVLMLNGFSTTNLTYNPIIYGLFPILFCSAGFIITVLLGNISNKLIPIRLKNQNMYKVEIQNENAKIKSLGYYDSGNRAFGSNGELVVFVNECIYAKLMPDTENYIYVSTINGKSKIKTTKGTIKIYFDGFENKIYNVSIALGELKNVNQQILLHAEMLGG